MRLWQAGRILMSSAEQHCGKIVTPFSAAIIFLFRNDKAVASSASIVAKAMKLHHHAICETVQAPHSVEHLFNCQSHLTTYSAIPVGQSSRSRGLPQSGQLMTWDELLGYHNNNNCTAEECSCNVMLHVCISTRQKCLTKQCKFTAGWKRWLHWTKDNSMLIHNKYRLVRPYTTKRLLQTDTSHYTLVIMLQYLITIHQMPEILLRLYL